MVSYYSLSKFYYYSYPHTALSFVVSDASLNYLLFSVQFLKISSAVFLWWKIEEFSEIRWLYTIEVRFWRHNREVIIKLWIEPKFQQKEALRDDARDIRRRQQEIEAKREPGRGLKERGSEPFQTFHETIALSESEKGDVTWWRSAYK